MRCRESRFGFLALTGWAVLLVVAMLFPGQALAQAVCGPIDLVFVVDTTGSMGGAEDNVKADLEKLLATIQSYSGGDYRLGLVEFKDDVKVTVDLSAGNTATVSAGLRALEASGGGGEPEASDEAINTVVSGYKASDRAAGKQTGDFNGRFRAEAAKIIIIVTDARPAGFDDDYTEGVDDVNAHAIALKAAAADIHINSVYVPTGGGDIGTTVEKILTDYSATSSGKYIKANSDGTGTADAIAQIIIQCGGAIPGFTLLAEPAFTEMGNGEDFAFKVTAIRKGRFDQDITLAAGEDLPEGSTLSFDPVTILNSGDGTSIMTFHSGDLTIPGEYFVTVTGTSADGLITRTTTVKVAVRCQPPFIYGLPENQPQSQTVAKGERGTLTVVPNGSGPFHYQWYVGARSSTFFPVAGATSQTLITPPINTPTDFWVRVSNACGSYDSFTATVTPSATKSGGSRGRPVKRGN